MATKYVSCESHDERSCVEDLFVLRKTSRLGVRRKVALPVRRTTSRLHCAARTWQIAINRSSDSQQDVNNVFCKCCYCAKSAAAKGVIAERGPAGPVTGND